MKNYTDKERQEIYEHLLTLDCPDLLASLVAQRADKTFMVYEASNYTSLEDFIKDAFLWEKSEEGWKFWNNIHEDVLDIENPDEPDVIESTEREMFNSLMKVHDVDFESPTESGTLILTSPSKIEFKVDSTVFEEEMEKINLTISQPTREGESFKEFWAKVKLFFGRWGYKV